MAKEKIKINLQLFAEGEPSGANPPAAAGQEPAPNTNPNPPGANPPAAAEPDVEKAFAARLHQERQKISQEVEGKAKDTVIAEMGMTWNGKPITTYAEYQKAIAEQKTKQEASKVNIDPAVYNRLVEAEQTSKQAMEKLSKFEQKEVLDKQAKELSEDKRWGKFFSQNKDEIFKKAEEANCDLNIAKLLVLNEKYEEPDFGKLKTDAVKEYIDGLKKGNKPIEGPGTTPVTVPGTPKSFEEARKGALEMLRASKQ